MTAQDLMRLGFARYMVKLGKYTDQCELTEHEAAWELPPKRHEIWTAKGLVMVDE